MRCITAIKTTLERLEVTSVCVRLLFHEIQNIVQGHWTSTIRKPVPISRNRYSIEI